jgi:hypothetical protein
VCTADLGRFCRAVLYECVVLEKPAMLHTHLFLYTTLLALKDGAAALAAATAHQEEDAEAARSALDTAAAEVGAAGAPPALALWNLKVRLKA